MLLLFGFFTAFNVDRESEQIMNFPGLFLMCLMASRIPIVSAVRVEEKCGSMPNLRMLVSVVMAYVTVSFILEPSVYIKL